MSAASATLPAPQPLDADDNDMMLKSAEGASGLDSPKLSCVPVPTSDAAPNPLSIESGARGAHHDAASRTASSHVPDASDGDDSDSDSSVENGTVAVQALGVLSGPVVDRLYAPLLRRHDRPRQRYRKLGLAALLVAAVALAPAMPLFFIFYGGAANVAETPGRLVAALALAPVILTWIATYVYARTKRSSSGVVVGAATGALYLSTALLSVSSLAFPVNLAWTLVLLATLLLRPPRMTAWLLLGVLCHAVAAYSDATFHRDAPDRTSLTVPDALNRGLATRIVFAAIAVCSTLIVVAALAAQLHTLDGVLERVEAALGITRGVVDALGRYDTDDAQELLDAAEEAHDVNVDAALLKTLQALVGNLKRFRPHIPNWVVMNAEAHHHGHHHHGHHAANNGVSQVLPMLHFSQQPGVAGAASEDGVLQRSGGGGSTQRVPVVPGASVTFAVDLEGTTSTAKNPALRSSGSDDHLSASRSGAVTFRALARAKSIARARSFARGGVSFSGGLSTTGSTTGSSSGSSAHVLATGATSSRGPSQQVALVVLDVRFSGTVRGTNASPALTGAMDAIVDHAHFLARQLGAAFHSMLGDRITLSFGAASPCANPGSRAVKLLLRWRATPPCDESVARVTGAAEAGAAAVHVAGKGQQQALVVHAPWTADVFAMAGAARAANRMLVSGWLRSRCAHVYKFQPAAVAVAAAEVAPSAGEFTSNPTMQQVKSIALPEDFTEAASATSGQFGALPGVDEDSQTKRIVCFEPVADASGDGADDTGEWVYEVSGALRSPGGPSGTPPVCTVGVTEVLRRWQRGELHVHQVLEALERGQLDPEAAAYTRSIRASFARLLVGQ